VRGEYKLGKLVRVRSVYQCGLCNRMSASSRWQRPWRGLAMLVTTFAAVFAVLYEIISTFSIFTAIVLGLAVGCLVEIAIAAAGRIFNRYIPIEDD